MSESKFKNMRHIETVRNYLNTIIRELLYRAETHDQTKLQPPEIDIFEEFTPKLRETTYGSDQYKEYMRQMKPAIDHHNKHNRHHPEHHSPYYCPECKEILGEVFSDGTCMGCRNKPIKYPAICTMNLIDLLEMLCDWKAATLRHNDGDIFKSLEINQKRFGYSDEVKMILLSTIMWIETTDTKHKANES